MRNIEEIGFGPEVEMNNQIKQEDEILEYMRSDNNPI